MGSGLTRERIVDTALALVSEEGLDALSMRKVASALDVEAMSLYRHVQNKADLLDALHDELISRVPVTGSGRWPDEVRRLAMAFREVLFAHPRAVPLVATRAARTPRAMAVLESGIAMLEDQGFSETRAIAAFQAVFCFVIGHAVFHTAQAVDNAQDPWPLLEFEHGLAMLVAGMADEAHRYPG